MDESGNILEVKMNTEFLRHRKETTSISKGWTSTMGYIVSETPDGLLIWCKIDGGSLISAPKEALYGEPLPAKNILKLTTVGVKAKKIIPENQCPRFTVISHQCNSVCVLQDETPIYQTFPAFLRDGVMMCILGPELGCILKVDVTRNSGDNIISQNPNRPTPQLEEMVYCPPWSFIEASLTVPWQAYCRIGRFYRARVTFIRESALAYGCHWVAVAVQRIASSGSPPVNGQTAYEQQQADRHLALYDEYASDFAKRSDWNKEESRKHLVAGMKKAAMGESGSDDKESAQKYAILHEFVQERKEQEAASAIASASGISASSYAGATTSVSAQTDIDNQCIEEVEIFNDEALAALDPQHYEEFMARFGKLFKK